MTRKELKNTIKNELKLEAILIREAKNERRQQTKYINPCCDCNPYPRKNCRRDVKFGGECVTNYTDWWKILRNLYRFRRDYRHRHIAYCIFFNNTPYENIERKCENYPDFASIKDYIKIWMKELNYETEDVCLGT